MSSLRLGTVLFFCLASAGLLACGSDDSGGGGDVAHGQALVQSTCMGCHNTDLSGSTAPLTDPNHPGVTAYSSNITPDVATGIGDWTDQQLDDAIRKGIDDADKPMCPPMPIYSSMSDTDAKDIIAYLRSVPPVVREVEESVCGE
jgi:mono/diheme cytochrome c family protein